MNILLSRILTYLNGTLFHDYNYKICTFIIFHYLEMEDMSEEKFLKKGCFKKEELYAFISLLGFQEYEEFKRKGMYFEELRAKKMQTMDEKKEGYSITPMQYFEMTTLRDIAALKAFVENRLSNVKKVS